MTDEQFGLVRGLVQRERRRLWVGLAAVIAPGPLVVFLGPALGDGATFITALVIGLMGVGGTVCSVDAAGRLVRWGRVTTSDHVEIFSGDFRLHQTIDRLTARIVTKSGMDWERTYYLGVLLRNGVLISVDGRPPKRFIQGRVAVTAPLRTATTPLDALERRELQLIAERALRRSLWNWPWWLGISAGFGTLIGSPLFLTDAGMPLQGRLLATLGLAGAFVALAAIVSRVLALRRMILMERDAETGPIAVGQSTTLPLSGLIWTVTDYPGPERLADGGLAHATNGERSRGTTPVTF